MTSHVATMECVWLFKDLQITLMLWTGNAVVNRDTQGHTAMEVRVIGNQFRIILIKDFLNN